MWDRLIYMHGCICRLPEIHTLYKMYLPNTLTHTHTHTHTQTHLLTHTQHACDWHLIKKVLTAKMSSSIGLLSATYIKLLDGSPPCDQSNFYKMHATIHPHLALQNLHLVPNTNCRTGHRVSTISATHMDSQILRLVRPCSLCKPYANVILSCISEPVIQNHSHITQSGLQKGKKQLIIS